MKKYIIVVLVFLSALFLGACGGSSSSGGSDSAGGDSEGGGSSSLAVTGTLSSANMALSALKANTDADIVTDVLAVSSETGDRTCVTVEIESDGTFDVPITAGRIWSFFFYNRYRSGWGMFSGWFRGSTFDALAPNVTTGDIDIGTVSVDAESQVASSDKDESAILSDLNVTSETASTLDNIDDITGRYSNPDVDNDGVADCSQSDRNIMLDFHIRFYLPVNGTNATVSDIIDGFLSADATATSYSGTGVYVSYLNAYSSAKTGTVTFANSSVKMEGGTTYPAGTEIQDNASDNSFGDYNSYGVNFATDSELPSGQIVFKFSDKTITFSNVETPSLAAINAPSGRLFIFIKFDKADPGCTSNCKLSSFGYKWMKKTAAGWTTPTLEEIGMVVADTSANMGFRVDDDANRYIGVAIPDDALSGSIAWTPSNFTLTGTTTAEFENLVTTQICHISLAFDDKMGMRYFHNIADAAGTCL